MTDKGDDFVRVCLNVDLLDDRCRRGAGSFQEGSVFTITRVNDGLEGGNLGCCTVARYGSKCLAVTKCDVFKSDPTVDG